jgi:hypothetical protein
MDLGVRCGHKSRRGRLARPVTPLPSGRRLLQSVLNALVLVACGCGCEGMHKRQALNPAMTKPKVKEQRPANNCSLSCQRLKNVSKNTPMIIGNINSQLAKFSIFMLAGIITQSSQVKTQKNKGATINASRILIPLASIT